MTAWYGVLCSVKWCTKRCLFKTPFQDPLQQLLLRLKQTNYAGLQGHLPHGECASTVADRDRVTRGNWTHDHFRGGGGPYNWYLIHNVEKSTFSTGWPPNTPYDCAEARRTQVADATFRDMEVSYQTIPSSNSGNHGISWNINQKMRYDFELTRNISGITSSIFSW